MKNDMKEILQYFSHDTQENILQQLQTNNPKVKTTLKPNYAKSFVCCASELILQATKQACDMTIIFRLLQDEDLKTLFDEDFNSTIPKNRKLAKIYFHLLNIVLEVKNFCHTIIEIASVQNNILLGKNYNNDIMSFIEKNKSLDAIVDDLIGEENISFENENTQFYKNPIELLANFLTEYLRIYLRNKDELKEHEIKLFKSIQEAIKEYYEIYQQEEQIKNADFFNKIRKIISI